MGSCLRLMFEDWPLEIVREEDGHAEYVLHHARDKMGEEFMSVPSRFACCRRRRRCG